MSGKFHPSYELAHLMRVRRYLLTAAANGRKAAAFAKKYTEKFESSLFIDEDTVIVNTDALAEIKYKIGVLRKKIR